MSRGKKNCKVHLHGEIFYYVIFPTSIVKEIEKLVLYVYSVIMHLENVKRMLEKRILTHFDVILIKLALRLSR